MKDAMRNQMLLIAILTLAAGTAAAQTTVADLTPQNLQADPSPGASSDGNGVLEPGETALIQPAWTNNTSSEVTATGSVSGFTGRYGPAPGETYIIADGVATYGPIGGGASGSCAASDCYSVSVSVPSSRPATHWDARFRETLTAGADAPVSGTWAIHMGDSFTDVPRSHPFYKKIETLLHGGITSGCSESTYCPSYVVRRGQMALFVARAVAGTDDNIPADGRVLGKIYHCVAGGSSAFADVLPTDIFCKAIHYIASQNVTLGCSATQFCPNEEINRNAMAALLAKAIVVPRGGPFVPEDYTDPVTGNSYSCNAASPSLHFADVPVNDPFCKHIHYLWAKSIVSGCGPASFCPDQTVDRGAMAKFLVNAFQLRLSTPITPTVTVTSRTIPSLGGGCKYEFLCGGSKGSFTVYSFTPGAIHIFAGETVTWVWTGTHSSTSGTKPTSDGIWDSGSTTGSFSHEFTQAGTFPYFCSVHTAFIHHGGTVIVDP
jgi:plastocyanin